MKIHAITYTPSGGSPRPIAPPETAPTPVRVAWRKKGCTTCRPIVVTAKPIAEPPKP